MLLKFRAWKPGKLFDYEFEFFFFQLFLNYIHITLNTILGVRFVFKNILVKMMGYGFEIK